MGGIDPQLAAVDFLTVELTDRFRGLGFTRELHKREAPRTAGFAVYPNVNVRDVSSCAESGGQLLFSGAKTQIANKDLR